MNHPLDNPVYHALISGDVHLAQGTGMVRYFDETVSPFAGFPIDHQNGFNDLFALLPPGRKILYATRRQVEEPGGWKLKAYIEGAQFVHDGNVSKLPVTTSDAIVPLTALHTAEMVQLAALTKPGPFALRTIDFGSYYGIFEGGRLAAMTGQRLHVYDHAEISAVCTHPDFLGKGYATTLLQHQLGLVLNDNKIPFLHVRADNARAISIYERLGFALNGPMHFYFLERKN